MYIYVCTRYTVYTHVTTAVRVTPTGVLQGVPCNSTQKCLGTTHLLGQSGETRPLAGEYPFSFSLGSVLVTVHLAAGVQPNERGIVRFGCKVIFLLEYSVSFLSASLY